MRSVLCPHIKEKARFSSSFIWFSAGVGREIKIWFKIGRAKVFNTTIFPMGVRFLLSQFLRTFFIVISLQSKFSLGIQSRLKLYCRYLYTRPCMINHIWSLKQLWLQVYGHAWFHLQRLRWPVRNGEGAKNSKWKYMSPAGFEPTPCQSTTGKLQRLRPLGHDGLMVISG